MSAMLKLLGWAIPLLVSVLLIQIVSDMLLLRAMERQPAGFDNLRSRQLRLPVHVIDREAASGGIIT
jgi:hypothetical protein